MMLVVVIIHGFVPARCTFYFVPIIRALCVVLKAPIWKMKRTGR
jgi:hypothetical protein